MSKYYVSSLRIEDLRDLIGSGDDTHDNQLRIKVDGEIFLSSDVGADNLKGIKARFETFDAYNGYVGPAAAADDRYIKGLFHAIQEWKENPTESYIDSWIW